MDLADAHYRLLVESIQDYAIYMLDPNGIVRSWNAGAERIKVWRAAEIIGKHVSVLYAPEDKERWNEQFERARAEGRIEDFGWRLRKDGTRFWASVVITALFENGTHIGFAKVTRDLTERTYRAFVEATNAIIWSTDGNGVPNADSPTWRAFTGQTEEEWRGLKGWDPVHPDDQGILRESWPRAKRERTTFEAEFRMRRKDGVYVWMAARAIPFSNSDGSVREWFGVTFDISARKRAEMDREFELNRWTTTLRSIGDGVIATDPEGRITFLNPVAEKLTGWRSEDAVGKPLPEVFKILNELTRQPVDNPVEKVLREGRTVGLANHTLLVRRDGSETPIDDSAAPILSADGLHGVVLVFRDASIEKRNVARRAFLAQAGEDLLASENYRDALARVARLAVPRLADWCAIDVVEPQGVERLAVEHVDPAKIAFALEISRRYPPNPNAPTGVPNVLRTGKSELYPEIPQELLERAAVDGEHLRLIRELDLRSAMIVPLRGKESVYGAMTFVFAESGRHYNAEDLALAEDLASRAGLVIERRRLEREAERANRMKDEFLAMVSHELRTPLQAIIGWAAILKRGTPDPTKAIGAIERNATTQARLIDDMLDVSRIISGKLGLAVRRVDVASVIRNAIDAVRPSAASKNVVIHERLASDLGDIEADPDRIQQIVWNLVTNAVKFTEAKGTVTVSATRGENIEISVADTGRGLAPDHLRVIFERFRQVDASTTREYGGLGLGLAIVRYLAEAHGGTVEASSDGLGKGAVFTVRLPARVPDTAPHAGSVRPSTIADLAGVRILLVENDDDSRELVAQVLQEAGATVETARSASEAFGKLTARPPDLLISDIGMPLEDGHSLLRRIRALPADKGGTVPAIAVTAFANEDDVRAAEAAGFQRHLAKPVGVDALIEAVRVLASR